MPLGKFAYLLTGSLDLSRDLTHEALTKAAQSGLDFSAPWARAYLRKTVANLWKRRLRRLTMETKAWLAVSSIEATAQGTNLESLSDRDLVWKALLRIPHGTRVCLVLRYYEDLPLQEIAKEVGRPVGTVKSRINRGLKKMAIYIRRAS